MGTVLRKVYLSNLVPRDPFHSAQLCRHYKAVATMSQGTQLLFKLSENIDIIHMVLVGITEIQNTIVVGPWRLPPGIQRKAGKIGNVPRAVDEAVRVKPDVQMCPGRQICQKHGTSTAEPCEWSRPRERGHVE